MLKFKTIVKNTLKILKSPAKKDYYVSAVILAGGNGTRFGGDTPKQFMKINGLEVAARTVMAFEASYLIKEIVIVGRAEDKAYYQQICEKYGFKKVKSIVSGGNTRFESAKRGYAALSDETEFVAIHDAARCLITPENIKDIAYAAFEYGAAVPCCKLTDTVKIINSEGFATSTPERATLRAVQTPQIFRSELYCAALLNAEKKGLEVTDDAGCVEALGYCVKTVDIGKKNIKITYKEDIAEAERILDSQNRGKVAL